MRVLVFGDSITQGYWDVTGGWVDKLRRYYDEQQIADLKGRDEPTVFNLGVSADSSSDILKRIEAETLARTRHNNRPVIIIQIGINDASTENGRPQQTIEQYKDNLRQIIQKTKLICSKLIFVGSSCVEESKTNPVFWGEFYYTNQNTKDYEQAMAKVAQELGISYVPVFEAFSEAFARNPSLLPDGLHPNEAGHQTIFDIVKPQIEKLLM